MFQITLTAAEKTLAVSALHYIAEVQASSGSVAADVQDLLIKLLNQQAVEAVVEAVAEPVTEPVAEVVAETVEEAPQVDATETGN